MWVAHHFVSPFVGASRAQYNRRDFPIIGQAVKNILYL